jgi:thymidylate synthase (FAD)
MKVKLLSNTPNPIKTVYTACRTCYSKDNPEDIYNQEHDIENMLNLIDKVVWADHTSILEHVSFTFSLSGLSRVCSQQLLRKRIGASPSQKSQRYCLENDFNYIFPHNIFNNSKLREEYFKLMDSIKGFYNSCIENKIPKEDARSVLPNSCTTSLLYTINLRSFIELCNQRLCVNAQSEINSLVSKMISEMYNDQELEFFTRYMIPKCEKQGYCNEIKPCGKYKLKKIDDIQVNYN